MPYFREKTALTIYIPAHHELPADLLESWSLVEFLVATNALTLRSSRKNVCVDLIFRLSPDRQVVTGHLCTFYQSESAVWGPLASYKLVCDPHEILVRYILHKPNSSPSYLHQLCHKFSLNPIWCFVKRSRVLQLPVFLPIFAGEVPLNLPLAPEIGNFFVILPDVCFLSD